jgi:hypothetical protein
MSREMTLDEAAEWLAWDRQRCEAELAALRTTQALRTGGADPTRWLIPDELEEAYQNDHLVHAVFTAAVQANHQLPRPPASVASREAVLVRLVSMILQDRARLQEEYQRIVACGPPPVILTRG